MNVWCAYLFCCKFLNTFFLNLFIVSLFYLLSFGWLLFVDYGNLNVFILFAAFPWLNLSIIWILRFLSYFALRRWHLTQFSITLIRFGSLVKLCWRCISTGEVLCRLIIELIYLLWADAFIIYLIPFLEVLFFSFVFLSFACWIKVYFRLGSIITTTTTTGMTFIRLKGFNRLEQLNIVARNSFLNVR